MTDVRKKRGRNYQFLKMRDKKLIERYYYWSEIKRRRFDDVLLILSEQEFFLHPFTIQLIIKKNNEYLDLLIKQRKTTQLELFPRHDKNV